MNRPSSARIVLAGMLMVGVGADFVAPASQAAAPSHKTSSTVVNLDNATWTQQTQAISAGAFTLYFRVTNTSSGSQAVPYGSFQLKVPTGISVPRTGGASLVSSSPTNGNFNAPSVDATTTPETITVTSNGPTGDGIVPGGSLTISVSGIASASVCPGTWGVEVKQSNDFSGSGNDFLGNNVSTPVSGGAQLIWTTQPMDTEYDKDMGASSVPPAPPAVTLEDACGNPVSITSFVVSDAAGALTPQTPAISGGTATLNHVQFSDYGFSDTLTATANGVSATSTSFNVFQSWQICGSGPCSTPTLGTKLGETLVGVVTGGGIAGDQLSAGVKGVVDPTDTCGGTTSEPAIGEIVSFNINGRSKTVTMTLAKNFVLVNPNNGTPFMDICLDTTASGTTWFDKRHYANPGLYPNKVSIGLLPDCSVTGTDGGPCVTSRKKNAGNEIITFTAPAGDPVSHWS